MIGALLVVATLAVTTSAGPAGATAPSVRVPNRPTNATAWSGDATVFLRFSPPAATGSAVTGYRVTAIVDGKTAAPRSFPASQGTLTYAGLRNGSTTRFRISAVTAHGAGAAAETRSVVVGRNPLSSSASWLDVVNYVRQTSRIPLVTENAAWTKGLQAHSLYLSRTPASQRVGAYASSHTENPASPWYTTAGQAAAANADLTVGKVGTARTNISDWLSSPFHAIGIIRPALRASAYASVPGAAGIDVIRGLSSSSTGRTGTVLLPGPGAVTTTRAYTAAERPNPLDSCPGFRSAGLPIVALLPSAAPARVVASLRQPDGTVLGAADLCIITARNYTSSDAVYGAAGRAVLQDSNAVVIIPRKPLQLGRQTVSLAPAGQATITWSFSIVTA